MYTELIGATTVRGFKSAVISPVVSNKRGERRETPSEIVLWFVSISQFYIYMTVIFDLCFFSGISCVTTVGDTFLSHYFLEIWGFKKVLVEWPEGKTMSYLLLTRKLNLPPTELMCNFGYWAKKSFSICNHYKRIKLNDRYFFKAFYALVR